MKSFSNNSREVSLNITTTEKKKKIKWNEKRFRELDVKYIFLKNPKLNSKSKLAKPEFIEETFVQHSCYKYIWSSKLKYYTVVTVVIDWLMYTKI